MLFQDKEWPSIGAPPLCPSFPSSPSPPVRGSTLKKEVSVSASGRDMARTSIVLLILLVLLIFLVLLLLAVLGQCTAGMACQETARTALESCVGSSISWAHTRFESLHERLAQIHLHKGHLHRLQHDANLTLSREGTREVIDSSEQQRLVRPSQRNLDSMTMLVVYRK